MADPSAPAPASASFSRFATASPKLTTTCLCSPTNHPGSFRCSRHRSPRGRQSSSSFSSSYRASQAVPGVQAAHGEGTSRSGGGGAGRGKGRSVLRAHLLRMISPPSSGRDHRRLRRLRRDFQPRPSRLGLVSA